MVSLKTIFSVAAVLATAASALPASIRLTSRQANYYKLAVRQNAMAKSMNLTDPVILNFALTLEHLESSFYDQALNESGNKMDDNMRNALRTVRDSEATHVVFLTSSLAQTGAKPVESCKYNFNTSDVNNIIKTAAVLENVGVGAYLGAAPAISDKNVLSAAASIATVEARHQTSIRSLLKQDLVPQPFDSSLSPRAAFTLAKPFIASCPDGSNLPIEPFPALTMMPGQESAQMTVGSSVKLLAEQGAGSAKNCAFTTTPDQSPGGALFVSFSESEGCQVPQGVSGITYVFLTSSNPADSAVTDAITVAGPMAMVLS
ncbi:ferritin-like domain-containing protein [Hirsutella rhossiliensis]|uniref:Ferritin-like domain-containing protein n=1 Tax=Hirsutella rhossiliensis TaxID=111463 RepID=A0A9P8SJR1_9HYPO|nr:ferritin-like domain-containing protein [Hirsutella rhossiliensis]KAH0965176.1 ferritin-like domain-containing protein [Hirsutella rhossiliensis]